MVGDGGSSVVAGAAQAARAGLPVKHESILVYNRYRYLKIAAAAVAISILAYWLYVPYGTRYGGTLVGYVLGTVAALTIFWLTWFGYRKRSYNQNQGKLQAWLSAHVYFGLALIVIATLHTGFSFGWNVHTLAYVLMLLVIGSGICGVFFYVLYPTWMTTNRHGATTQQLLTRIAAINDELRVRAMHLDDASVALLRRSIDDTRIGGSILQQLTGRYACTTAYALSKLGVSESDNETVRQVRLFLNEKAQLLARVREDVRYKAMMDVWLYVHVPITFALLAALTAHIIAVFYYF
jgi:hypothetical protein